MKFVFLVILQNRPLHKMKLRSHKRDVIVFQQRNKIKFKLYMPPNLTTELRDASYRCVN